MARPVWLIALLGIAVGRADAQPAPSIAHLRQPGTCGSLANCFEDTSDLTDWLWGGGRVSEPSENDRVLVVVGPGDFERFVCLNEPEEPSEDPFVFGADGYVTVVGAGRGQTRFVSKDSVLDPKTLGFHAYGAITAHACHDLNFQDLTAYGRKNGALWVGGGSATWIDVDLVGGGSEAGETGSNWDPVYGWADVIPGPGSLQYFFGSRIIALGAKDTQGLSYHSAFFSVSSSENWFFGGEILAEPNFDVPGSSMAQAAVELKAAELQTFGTSVRSSIGSAVSNSPTDPDSPDSALRFYSGVRLSQSASFHMHGGIVSTDASTSTQSIIARAVDARGGSHVHALDAAFEVKPSPTGSARRIYRKGDLTSVEAPFLWPPASSPPNAVPVEEVLISGKPPPEEGIDLFVDTAAGPGGDEAHVMVHDSQCAMGNTNGGPWRDLATDQCRVP